MVIPPPQMMMRQPNDILPVFDYTKKSRRLEETEYDAARNVTPETVLSGAGHAF